MEGLAGAARHMLAEPDGVRKFQDARIFFEVGLARHAAKHATAADLRALADALDANKQSIGDLAKFERTDVAFHYVLAVIPQNPIYTALHSAIADWLVEQRHVTLAYPGQNQLAYRAHKAIYDAIAAKDAGPRRAGDQGASQPDLQRLLAGRIGKRRGRNGGGERP